jgi:hypothetical protein
MTYKPVSLWVIISILLGVISTIAIHAYSLETGFLGFAPLASLGDDRLYWDLSQKIQEGNAPENLIHIYPAILAFLFSVLGRNIIYGKLFNILCYVLIVFYGILTTRILCQLKQLPLKDIKFASYMAGAILAIYPSQLFYSTQLFKDPLLTLCGIANLYYFISLFREPARRTFLFWLITFAGLFNLRPYAAISLLLSMLSYLIFVWKTKRSRKFFVVAAFVLAITFLPSFFGLGLFASDLISPWFDGDKLTEFRESAYADASSSVDISIDYSNPVSFLFTFSISFATVILGPFPWQIRSIAHLIAFPEALILLSTLIWMNVFSSATNSQARSKSSVELLPLFACLVSAGFIALFSDNIGATSRIRILAWDFLFIYISVVLASYRSSRRSKRLKSLEQNRIHLNTTSQFKSSD